MKRIMILAACAVMMSLNVSAQTGKPGTQSSGNSLNNMDMSRQPGTWRTQEQRQQSQNMNDSRELERQSYSPGSIDAQRERDQRIGQDTSRIPRRDTVRTPVPTPPVPPPVPTPSDTPGRR